MIHLLILILIIQGLSCYNGNISPIGGMTDLPPYKLEHSVLDPVEEIPHELRVLIRRLASPKACLLDLFPMRPDFTGLTPYYYDLIYGGKLPRIKSYYKMANLFRLLLSQLPNPLIPSLIMSELHELNQYVPTNGRPLSFTEMLMVAKVFHKNFIGREILKRVLMFFSNYAHSGCVPGGFVGIAKRICDDLTVPFMKNMIWFNCREPSVYLAIANLLKLGPKLISRTFNIFKNNPQLRLMANSIHLNDQPFGKEMSYRPSIPISSISHRYASSSPLFSKLFGRLEPRVNNNLMNDLSTNSNPFASYGYKYIDKRFMGLAPFIEFIKSPGSQDDIMKLMFQLLRYKSLANALENSSNSSSNPSLDIPSLVQNFVEFLKEQQLQKFHLYPAGSYQPLYPQNNINHNSNMNPFINPTLQNIGIHNLHNMNQVNVPNHLPFDASVLNSPQLYSIINQIENRMRNPYHEEVPHGFHLPLHHDFNIPPHQDFNVPFHQDYHNLNDPNLIGYGPPLNHPYMLPHNVHYPYDHPMSYDDKFKDEISTFLQMLISFTSSHPDDMAHIIDYIKEHPLVISDILDVLNLDDLRDEYEEYLISHDGNINADLPQVVKFMTELVNGHIKNTVHHEIIKNEKNKTPNSVDHLYNNITTLLLRMIKLLTDKDLENRNIKKRSSYTERRHLPSDEPTSKLSDDEIFRYVSKFLDARDRVNHPPIIINVIPRSKIQKDDLENEISSKNNSTGSTGKAEVSSIPPKGLNHDSSSGALKQFNNNRDVDAKTFLASILN